MAYNLIVKNNKLYSSYYGPKASHPEQDYPEFIERLEVPVRGGEANKTPQLEIEFKDGTRDLDLMYEGWSESKEGDYVTLRIDQKDTYFPLVISSFYRILPEYDIIEKWLEIKNLGTEVIKIDNALSGSLWLPPAEYELLQYSGLWGQEFQPKSSELTQGRKIFEVRDFKSYGSSLFSVGLKNNLTEDKAAVWYGQLHYSGNWKVELDKQADGSLQILSGINFWDTDWNLRSHEVFKTPKFSFGYTDNGLGEVSRNFSAYIRNVLLPNKDGKNKKVRPVIYNSWYATEFDVNEKQQLALAKVAKKIGVETFVIDDGWFKGRVDDKGGLGDWTVDKNKFPNGLNPMIKKINEMGMDFGIWVEPEMVNPNSDLYRSHPDWVMHFNNRNRTTGRNQLILNLAREDVYQYLYDSLHKLLTENNIKYLKWDMNKTLTEPGWPDADPLMRKEVRIRYVNNVYRLVDSLRKEFPDVWLENCSSGGGRVDLGMFSRMDVVWASDNIDPLDRIFIQYGYLSAFPANTMVSWTGKENWHDNNYPLDFRFNVAMSGVLGIGNDITKWGNGEVETASRKITEYKSIRNVTQNGTLYRIASPFTSARSSLQYVSDDKSETVVFCYQLADQLKGSSAFPVVSEQLKLQGLNAKATYTVKAGNDKKTYTGEELMQNGITWPVKGTFNSIILSFISN
ncbi:MAG: alpha-galactosidase, partial [Flavobacterium sp.]|nr:alpha-galactosidase [Pedobacter sp.]